MCGAGDFVIEGGVLKKYVGRGGDVVIPDGVTSIGREAFAGCKSVTSVTLPDGAKEIWGRVFADCENLTSVTIPDSVKKIGDRAFENCENLTSITLPEGIRSIGWWTFKGCKSLTRITLPDSVTRIGWLAFADCKSLKSIAIPDGVTRVSSEAFNGCESLSYHVFDRANYLGSEANPYTLLVGATSKEIESCTIHPNTKMLCASAFADCKNLKRVTIPDGVTSIDALAFKDCGSLTSVVIPDSVTRIGPVVFDGCDRLTDVTWPSALAKELQNCMPETKHTIVLHIRDISDASAKFRPGAAAGFAEDERDCTDENGKKYLKYIKANAVKLAGLAAEHPALLYLMLREKLIAAKDLQAATAAVQASGDGALIAAILDYGSRAVSEADKAKLQRKKDEREEAVTSFVFGMENPEKLRGKAFVVAGRLKTFRGRDELRECLEACGATLSEALLRRVDSGCVRIANYLITDTPNADTAKHKKAAELNIACITEAQFNEMIGRNAKK